MWKNLLKTGTTALSPWMIYIKVGLVALIIGIMGTHLWNDRQRVKELGEVTRELGALKNTNEGLVHSALQNELALVECLDANAWNALQAKEQEIKAAKALANVRHLKELNARNAEDIHREEATLRNRDKECRTADEPLPDWLLPDSLWDN